MHADSLTLSAAVAFLGAGLAWLIGAGLLAAGAVRRSGKARAFFGVASAVHLVVGPLCYVTAESSVSSFTGIYGAQAMAPELLSQFAPASAIGLALVALAHGLVAFAPLAPRGARD